MPLYQNPPISVPHRSGYYYTSRGLAAFTTNYTQNTLYGTPFVVPRNTTYTKVALVVTAVASTNCRVGVYQDGGGIPTNLISELATLDTHTAGGLITATISLPLQEGSVWLACAVQGGAATLGNISTAGIGVSELGLVNPNSDTTAVLGYTQTGISGALPTTWGATLTTSTNLPAVFLAPQ